MSGIGGTLGFALLHGATSSISDTWQNWFASDALGIVTIGCPVRSCACATCTTMRLATDPTWVRLPARLDGMATANQLSSPAPRSDFAHCQGHDPFSRQCRCMPCRSFRGLRLGVAGGRLLERRVGNNMRCAAIPNKHQTGIGRCMRQALVPSDSSHGGNPVLKTGIRQEKNMNSNAYGWVNAIRSHQR